jgi:hypothetical protein
MEVGCAGILVSDTFCGPMAELPRRSAPGSRSAAYQSWRLCSKRSHRPGQTGHFSRCSHLPGRDPSASTALSPEIVVGVDRIVVFSGSPPANRMILLVEGQDRALSIHSGPTLLHGGTHRSELGAAARLLPGGLFLMPDFRFEARSTCWPSAGSTVLSL